MGSAHIVQSDIFDTAFLPKIGESALQRCHRYRKYPVVAFGAVKLPKFQNKLLHPLGAGHVARIAGFRVPNLDGDFTIRRIADFVPCEFMDFSAPHTRLIGPFDEVPKPASDLLRLALLLCVLLVFDLVGGFQYFLILFVGQEALTWLDALDFIGAIGRVAFY